MKTISIHPVTRLEGSGRIDIVLDEQGDVSQAYFAAVEFKGFERFCVGRPAEEMPRITSRVCGVCPTAHHMASTRALDDLFQVKPPAAAEAVRELVYNAFMLEDHLLHFFLLGGPDILMGHEVPASRRNIIGLLEHAGAEAVSCIMAARKAARAIIEQLGGKAVHPVMGLPGGVSRRADEHTRELAARAAALGREATDLGLYLLAQRRQQNSGLFLQPHQLLRTYYMGLVDERGVACFLGARVRVVGPDGPELCQFDPREYAQHIVERVEPHNYSKVPFLRQVGWKGVKDGPDSGVMRVGPLARINVAKTMASEGAEQERQALFAYFGGRPVHHTMAFHWARLVECRQACDRLEELGRDPLLDRDDVRAPVGGPGQEGIAAVEAPRGTLIHHYCSDADGMLTRVNLLVPTTHNMAAINLSVERAARALIKAGQVPEEPLLNQVEAEIRAYDPCLACATHALPGQMPLSLNILDVEGSLLRRIRRG